MQEPTVVLESYLGGASYAFSDLHGEVVAYKMADVSQALLRVDRAVEQGLHAAGFVSYEAASGINPALVTREQSDFPLVWFGLFRQRLDPCQGTQPALSYALSDWSASVTRPEYDEAMERIRDYIVAGDTYQVNHTFRLRAEFSGDPRGFYRALSRNQRTHYAAFLDIGRFQILSASPELFFRLKGGHLTTRPMKGTWPRGRWSAEDERHQTQLKQSEKNRSENVMIVDMLRNDLGMISKPGTVSVPSLWDVEPYETVLQMTSTVTSEVSKDIAISQVLKAMFPCGSVTGAPKVRTMQIISELELDARGIYTGSIGYISPGGEACFNVAIRTVCIDRESGTAEFGVGGGITFDSSPDGEYDECVTKARILTTRRTDFDLFETLRYCRDEGYFLLDRHLDRLAGSAAYFGFALNRPEIEGILLAEAERLGEGPFRVRCLLTRSGVVTLETVPLLVRKSEPWRVDFSPRPVDSQDVMLFHKTTDRTAYERRLADRPGCDEIILINERGEVTECAIGNLVVEIGGRLWTPPMSCGLLPGTFRAHLLDAGQIEERTVTIQEVRGADALFMINSVREWVSLTLVI
jgi:para-aminobenzoate synthetase / 4-amino-4-deoxychorismate lyase